MTIFSEDNIQETRRRGRIEVICGSMFSGKTEELIRRLKRAKFARQRVEIFKPAIDTRYSEEEVVSHDSNSIASTPVDSSASIVLFSSDIEVVGIDTEGQGKHRRDPGRQFHRCDSHLQEPVRRDGQRRISDLP